MSKQDKIKKEVTLDDLAIMVQNGFTELRTEFKKDLKTEINKLEEKMTKEMRLNTEELKAELNKKVDRFEHKTLEYRVEKLEKKYA